MNGNIKDGLYLLIDRDDLTVYSARFIQGWINDNTNFKTDVLKMFEQLVRNCQFFLDEVIKVSDPIEDFVEINAARYYLDLAKKFLNQFLEERDTFLEIDNMPKGSRKYFDYAKEMDEIIKYSTLIDKNKAAFHSINAFCMKKLEIIIQEAKKNKTIPNFGALFSIDSNDVIRGGSIDEKSAKEYILYEKPLELLRNCIRNEDKMHDIVVNGCVFYLASQEIIDYSKIHCPENANNKAINFIKKLINSGVFAGSYESTHQTGQREDYVKYLSEPILLPEVDGYISQRYHTEEHNVTRRGRSSKIEMAVMKLGIKPNQIVLIDDSVANCRDCQEKGGIAILYKPKTDSEIIKGVLEDTGFIRVIDFSEEELERVLDVCKKHKNKVLIK